MQKPQENLSSETIWALFQETSLQIKENDRKYQEMQKEMQREFRKEMIANDKKATKKLNKLEELFVSQWGKLIESLIEGDLIKLLNLRGIKVQNLSTRIKIFKNNRQYEFDIIAENGTEVVIVEVKTNLKVKNVKDFLITLNEIKTILPRYKDNIIIGAMAFLKSDERSEIFASSKGLFTIRSTGNSSSITNAKDFLPKYF
ncbi:MAG: hypothetical protein HW421_2664 [Ignavibacteria bacterium]|nr:hypothetical protein [Ignavibacteria bacterium]